MNRDAVIGTAASSFPDEAKSPGTRPGLFMLGSLALTYFRAVYPALSSAQLRFTVLFGMGRSGSRALWVPDLTCRPAALQRRSQFERSN